MVFSYLNQKKKKMYNSINKKFENIDLIGISLLARIGYKIKYERLLQEQIVIEAQ